MPGPHATTAPIRAAATVVVVRPRDHGLYGVVRSSSASFMPNALVFPGGRVDDADLPTAATGSGDPAQAEPAPGPDRIPDLGFRRAATRELAEEARMIVQPEALRWFDTWLTPSAETRRFLARFYLTKVSDDVADHAMHDGQEVTGSRWGSAPQLLRACSEGELDLPPPTLSILHWLSSSLPELLQDRVGFSAYSDDLELPILPKFVLEGGQAVILLPHSKHYDGAPGESGPVPQRLWQRNYPTRIVRNAGRWERVDE